MENTHQSTRRYSTFRINRRLRVSLQGIMNQLTSITTLISLLNIGKPITEGSKMVLQETSAFRALCVECVQTSWGIDLAKQVLMSEWMRRWTMPAFRKADEKRQAHARNGDKGQPSGKRPEKGPRKLTCDIACGVFQLTPQLHSLPCVSHHTRHIAGLHWLATSRKRILTALEVHKSLSAHLL